MPDAAASDPLQPALLDRLVDDARTATRFLIRTDAEALVRTGVELGRLVTALGSLGLRRIEADEIVSGIALAFLAPGRTVGLADVKGLKVRSTGRQQAVAVQEFCEVDARVIVNTRTDLKDRSMMSMRQLREYVFRDLGWLFNAISLDSVVNLERHPRVAASVINFGLPSMAGRTQGSVDPVTVAHAIRSCIERFESRLSKVRVTPVSLGESFEMGFQIEAELWGQPLPEQILMQTRIDLSTGDVTLTGAGGR